MPVKKFSNKGLLLSFTLIIVVAISLYAFWRYSDLHPSTDNAYVQANVVRIAAQISGPVATTQVKNFQAVKRGQLLFTIDATPFRLAMKKAEANLQYTEQKIRAAKATIKANSAKLQEAKAQLLEANQSANRILPLVRSGRASQSQGDSAKEKLNVAKAQVAQATNALIASKNELGASGHDNAQVRAAQATLQQAQLDLKHTRITAPASGKLVNFTLRPGTIVNANQPLFALVEQNTWWVDANYKETKLGVIRPGQTASITTDMYPSHPFKGVVKNISAGSGSYFSLLPPENASGNWVKVTQRFPVKIVITNPNPKYPLRPGASASVTIDAAQ